MTASDDQTDLELEHGARWLLLIHQIPAEPAYLRVKTSRRLKALGALALKSSVYVLPNGPATREDFEWLRREIKDGGGEATLVAGQFLQGTSDRELIEQFRTERNEEYGELVDAMTQASATAGSQGLSELGRFRQRLDRIRDRDHFQAQERAAAEQAMRALEEQTRGERGREQGKERAAMESRPRGATWVTRRDVYVDRMASAWLIRRFIDPKANFKFVRSDGYQPEPGELRFDMYEGELTHEGDRCTFETLVQRFRLDEPGLAPIAEIVHEMDCKDEKYARPEASGIASVLSGIASAHPNDRDRLTAAATVFDGLFERFRSSDS
jgi:hypothetical protein